MRVCFAAVVFLRLRTIWGRVFSLQGILLILVVKGILGGWLDGQFWPAVSFIILFFSFLLLPAMIGLLKRGVDALSSR